MSAESIQVLLTTPDTEDVTRIGSFLPENSNPPFRINHAPTLHSAITRVTHGKVDVALLELFLPDSQGVSTVGRFHRSVPEVPVVVLSNHRDEQLALQSLQEGAQEYLVKESLNSEMLTRVLRYTIERHRAQQKLNACLQELSLDEARLNALIKRHTQGILVIDKAGRVRFANPVAEELLGYSQRDLQELRIDLPLHSFEPTEVTLRDRDGAYRILEMDVLEIEWDQEDMYLAFIRDVTRRRHMEETHRQEEMLQNVRELAGAVAHEFSQPLTVLNNMLYLLKTEYGESPRIQACEQMVGRITDLVDHLRNIIRVEKRDYLSTRILDIRKSSSLVTEPE